MTFVICGEALYDVFVGEATPNGFALDARIGGSAFNAAIALARLGQPAGLFTGIATDALGDRLVAELAGEGVRTDFVVRKEAQTTLALVALGGDGGARYSFYADRAADRALEIQDLPDLEGGITGLAFGCLSLLDHPTGHTYLALAERARAKTGTRPLITLDPNIRPTVEPDMAVWRRRIAAFAGHADIIKTSDEDLAALYPDQTAEAVAGAWLKAGVALVAVTRGGDGALAYHRNGSLTVVAPDVAIVDTVGAGDTFLAGLVAGLAEGLGATPDAVQELGLEDLERVLGLAVAAAAVTCTRRGADPPRRSDL